MAIARAIMHEPAEIHAHTEYIRQYFCCTWCSEAPLHCATQSSPIRCFPGNLRFPEKARRSPGSDCGRAIQVVLVLLHRHHIRVCPKPVADTRSHEPETCTVYERRDSLRIKGNFAANNNSHLFVAVRWPFRGEPERKKSQKNSSKRRNLRRVVRKTLASNAK